MERGSRYSRVETAHYQAARARPLVAPTTDFGLTAKASASVRWVSQNRQEGLSAAITRRVRAPHTVEGAV